MKVVVEGETGGLTVMVDCELQLEPSVLQWGLRTFPTTFIGAGSHMVSQSSPVGLVRSLAA